MGNENSKVPEIKPFLKNTEVGSTELEDKPYFALVQLVFCKASF